MCMARTFQFVRSSRICEDSDWSTQSNNTVSCLLNLYLKYLSEKDMIRWRSDMLFISAVNDWWEADTGKSGYVSTHKPSHCSRRSPTLYCMQKDCCRNGFTALHQLSLWRWKDAGSIDFLGLNGSHDLGIHSLVLCFRKILKLLGAAHTCYRRVCKSIRSIVRNTSQQCLGSVEIDGIKKYWCGAVQCSQYWRFGQVLYRLGWKFLHQLHLCKAI